MVHINGSVVEVNFLIHYYGNFLCYFCLFFEPFTCNIYDYNDGMSDLKLLKLRTLFPAHVSFQEECGRLMLEMNYMLSYGAAAPSICLLQRFNLLNILLPFQRTSTEICQEFNDADGELGFRFCITNIADEKLFFNLEKLVSCDHPADSSLCIRDVPNHFFSCIEQGWIVDVSPGIGVEFARELGISEVKFVPEISGFSVTKSDEDLAKEVAQFASLVRDAVWALKRTSNLLESMSRYPFSLRSGLVSAFDIHFIEFLAF
ncbi:Cyclin B2,1 isoform 1 [Hibiscus syriacus]|uniref:Cyclin B2,1 isoform 1 n=1 Tax=Hibiscus syriacus TaxID=106335 RepID=A0A6A3AKM7_HIBSY|nr:Cyclin B2,1 isoform 1 [Hibiscus syriacus]